MTNYKKQEARSKGQERENPKLKTQMTNFDILSFDLWI